MAIPETRLRLIRCSWPGGWLTFALLVGFGLAVARASSGGVPEPDTVVYGQVGVPLDDQGRVYVLHEGRLRWTVDSPFLGGRRLELEADLESLADGRFSYRLDVPHQLLAYDFAVEDGFAPLTAGLQSLTMVRITLDGHSVSIVPPETGVVGVQQTSRASTRQVNLSVAMPTTDSDGDGLPDWLEDREGSDKWNPDDAAAVLARLGLGGNEGGDGSGGGMTLAHWREAHFPGSRGDLVDFALDDPDGDGYSNLAEYAHGLDPRVAEDIAPMEERVENGVLIVVCRQRQQVADLGFALETSPNLFDWSALDASKVTTVSEPVGDGSIVRHEYHIPAPTATDSQFFLRFRAEWVP